jgi:hypothetical protein
MGLLDPCTFSETQAGISAFCYLRCCADLCFRRKVGSVPLTAIIVAEDVYIESSECHGSIGSKPFL